MRRCAHVEHYKALGKRQAQLDRASEEVERVHTTSPRLPFMQGSQAEAIDLVAAYMQQLQVLIQ